MKQESLLEKNFPYLEVENVFFRYQNLPSKKKNKKNNQKSNNNWLLDDFNLTISQNEILCLLGPNGVGKTTVLRLLLGIIKPQRGRISLEGKELFNISRKKIATKIAILPQDSPSIFPYSVEQMVLFGRIPYLSVLGLEKEKDKQVAKVAMDLTGISHLAERSFIELSGGEKQKVLLARALAQEPKVLFLDEFSSHLDIYTKIKLGNLLVKLNHSKGLGILLITHDLNLAARYGQRIAVLHEGRICAEGSPEEVIRPEVIEKVFKCQAIIHKDAFSGRPFIIFPSELSDYSNQNQISSDLIKRFNKVHIICGGGSASVLLRELVWIGFSVTVGVLNIGDTDQISAELLGLKTISVEPFAPITAAAYEENCRLLFKSDFAILTPFDIGQGNLDNLKAALRFCHKGGRLFLWSENFSREVHSEKKVKDSKRELNLLSKQDWTAGEGKKLLDELTSKSFQVSSFIEMFAILREILDQNNT